MLLPRNVAVGCRMRCSTSVQSERGQRKIDQLLEEAEKAIDKADWTLVRARSEQVLVLDPENADASDYLTASKRGAGSSTSEA
jgi:hypothetical protein